MARVGATAFQMWWREEGYGWQGSNIVCVIVLAIGLMKKMERDVYCGMNKKVYFDSCDRFELGVTEMPSGEEADMAPVTSYKSHSDTHEYVVEWNGKGDIFV